MSYRAQKAHLEAVERALDNRVLDTRGRWQQLHQVAQRVMTPGRILGSGFLSGVVIGFTEPMAKLGASPRLIQAAAQFASLIGAMNAKAAADDAGDAADTATEAAVTAADAATAVEPLAAEVAANEAMARERAMGDRRANHG